MMLEPEIYIKSISSDRYKYEACSLTSEECEHSSCQTCEIAYMHSKEAKIDEQKAELEKYTKFKHAIAWAGLELLTNNANTIAKVSADIVKQLQEKGELSESTIPYSPDALKQYWTQLQKLKRYNNLSIPDEIWGEKDHPAVFRYGDVYYIIAPLLPVE